MKKFLFILVLTAALALLPAANAHAQFAIVAAATDFLLSFETIQQSIYWAQQAYDMATQIEQFAKQVEYLGRAAESQVRNLQNIGNIHSYKDFADWYNRQIYLERKTEETWDNMSFSIGKHSYKLTDAEGIAYAIQNTYVDPFENGFTEEQRKAVWVGLGMTPANYAYVQTWKKREEELVKRFIAAREIQNNDYKDDMDRNNEKLNDLEKDKEKAEIDPDDKSLMDVKGVAAITAEMSIHNNKKLNDIDAKLADIMDFLGTETLLDKDIKYNTPPVSDLFNSDEKYFKEISRY
jgi:hypothetical protein